MTGFYVPCLANIRRHIGIRNVNLKIYLLNRNWKHVRTIIDFSLLHVAGGELSPAGEYLLAEGAPDGESTPRGIEMAGKWPETWEKANLFVVCD